jgi:hypothetical protein
MKKVLVGLLVVGLVVALSVEGANIVSASEQHVTATQTTTVTVPTYVGIRDLDDLSFSLTFSGAPPVGSGSASDQFYVDANRNTTISADVTTHPETEITPYMSASVSPTSGTPGTTTCNLTVSANSVPLTISPGDYVEEVAVTVTYSL